MNIDNDELRIWFYKRGIIFDASGTRWTYKDGKTKLENEILEELVALLAAQRQALRDEVTGAIGEDITDENLIPELRGTVAGEAFKLARNSLRADLHTAISTIFEGKK